MSKTARTSLPSTVSVGEVNVKSSARTPAKPRGWKKWTRRLSRAFKGSKRKRRPQGLPSGDAETAPVEPRPTQNKGSDFESPTGSVDDLYQRIDDLRESESRYNRAVGTVDFRSGSEQIDEEWGAKHHIDREWGLGPDDDSSECSNFGNEVGSEGAPSGDEHEQHLVGSNKDKYDDQRWEDQYHQLVPCGCDSECEWGDGEQLEVSERDNADVDYYDEPYEQHENDDLLAENAECQESEMIDGYEDDLEHSPYPEPSVETDDQTTVVTFEGREPLLTTGLDKRFFRLECPPPYVDSAMSFQEVNVSTVATLPEEVNFEESIPIELTLVRTVARWCSQQGGEFDSSSRLFLACIDRKKWALASVLAELIERDRLHNTPEHSQVSEATLRDILSQCTA